MEEKNNGLTLWANGSQDLKKIITYLSSLNISIIDSNSGKSVIDYPYIMLKFDKNNINLLLYVASYFSNIKSTNVAILLDKDGNSVLKLSSNILNKKLTYKKIEEALIDYTNEDNNIDENDIKKIISSIWNTHLSLISHTGKNDNLYHQIYYTNGIFTKSLILKSDSKDIDDVMHHFRFKEIKARVNNKTFIARTFKSYEVLINKLDEVIEFVNEKYEKKECDLIINKKEENSFSDFKEFVENKNQIPNINDILNKEINDVNEM